MNVEKHMNIMVHNKEDICKSWINSKNVIFVLQKHDIDPKFFQKYFGGKVLDHIIEIFNNRSTITQSPIMYILTQFFKSKEIGISDIYVICTELAFVFQKYFNDETSEKLLEILDGKLSTVEDYMDVTREAIQSDTLFVLNTKTDKDRLKDIRFTSANDINSTELFNLLNDYQINAIDDLQLTIDNLLIILDVMTTLEPLQAYNKMPTFLGEFKVIEEKLNNLMLFPIISFSFKTLYDYLSVLSVNNFKDEDKKTLLFIMIIGLVEDLSKWIDTIFVQKAADDVYYADASFANNCLEIELIFDDNHEEKNTDLQGQIMDQSELMEYFL
jgi:hypothetical protein